MALSLAKNFHLAEGKQRNAHGSLSKDEIFPSHSSPTICRGRCGPPGPACARSAGSPSAAHTAVSVAVWQSSLPYFFTWQVGILNDSHRVGVWFLSVRVTFENLLCYTCLVLLMCVAHADILWVELSLCNNCNNTEEKYLWNYLAISQWSNTIFSIQLQQSNTHSSNSKYYSHLVNDVRKGWGISLSVLSAVIPWLK